MAASPKVKIPALPRGPACTVFIKAEILPTNAVTPAVLSRVGGKDSRLVFRESAVPSIRELLKI